MSQGVACDGASRPVRISERALPYWGGLGGNQLGVIRALDELGGELTKSEICDWMTAHGWYRHLDDDPHRNHSRVARMQQLDAALDGLMRRAIVRRLDEPRRRAKWKLIAAPPRSPGRPTLASVVAQAALAVRCAEAMFAPPVGARAAGRETGLLL